MNWSWLAKIPGVVFLTSENAGNYTALALAILGCGTLILSFWPQFLSTYKSKNSAVIPMDIFKFHLATSCALLLGSCFGAPGLSSKPFSVARVACFICINGFLLFTTGYTFWLKLTNRRKAKEMGISEEDYCKYYIRPAVKS